MLSALQVSRDQAKAKRASTRFVRAALDEKSILVDVKYGVLTECDLRCIFTSLPTCLLKQRLHRTAPLSGSRPQQEPRAARSL